MITTETLYWILFAIPSILIASTVHEYAHGLAAYKLGDPTAKAYGRLTLNPLKHIDPIGALSMVLFRFGWSKPVPINEYNFEKRELGTAIVSFAGPLSNLILAAIFGSINLIFHPDLGSIFGIFLFTFTLINISLAIFNLIPIPPLDGHKIVRAFLPKKIRYYWEKMEKFSFLFILLLIIPFSPIGKFVLGGISSILARLLALFGFL
ncbi:MAG TPA: site-2 protease family protein [Candidatus Dojkabacteria bacterium]|nr:site-2 protease family protein [Candidatus Dojkabacteria bacterium]